MHILFRAIITGFGLRLGAEIAKQVTKRVFVEDEANKTDAEKAEEAAEDDELPGTSPEPPTFGDDTGEGTQVELDGGELGGDFEAQAS